jgi:hypothetical protein
MLVMDDEVTPWSEPLYWLLVENQSLASEGGGVMGVSGVTLMLVNCLKMSLASSDDTAVVVLSHVLLET